MKDVKAEARDEGEEVGCDCDCGGGGDVGLRILVVDDSPVDRKIVERLLKKREGDFEVITVDSGKKAMDILGLNEGETTQNATNDQKIDIILTDYCMPEMTGYDLLKAVKEHNFPKNIPVFVMSSENDPQRISRCRANGAEDFILKPLRANDIQRLRSYAIKTASTPIAGSKRKLQLDPVTENGSSERRPRLAGVVA
ncbi:Two-component response regulator ARR9 [Apostasia shenzhenica]|uniref:Two-component response regulator ARR9 n=1 Tax=Apostasia shenzhenica TaxID=1088818 RepID=A0A2I0AK92_9ASPA|nr:Two-component response regulator ARR9 [Apostasia shenzhenica]